MKFVGKRGTLLMLKSFITQLALSYIFQRDDKGSNPPPPSPMRESLLVAHKSGRLTF